MDIERECSVCKEDASYFCRMCNLHYCVEHLCLHLNVAWENNTWTRRHENENCESRDVDAYGAGLQTTTNSRDTIQDNAKSLPAYTEEELQTQINFYMSQARRIRAELARREVFAKNPSHLPQGFNFSRFKSDSNTTKRYPKSKYNSVRLLSDQLRSGTINLAYVQNRLEYWQAKAKNKNKI